MGGRVERPVGQDIHIRLSGPYVNPYVKESFVLRLPLRLEIDAD